MKSKQGLLLVAALAAAVTLCSLSPTQESKEPGFKNLKVLSKKTTKREMDSVMQEFKVALGVRCNFCHAASKDDPRKMDFASDANRHKEITRDMMRMTNRISKKYLEVTCYTCHRGKEEPLLAPERPIRAKRKSKH
ncbi:c-type cytochrome [Chitinophaga horti]|uniref:Photosynthetic reaction center cytochrome c subunit n=1 Tax=Chitinophaga horti TaxID=2920382 RepID=A0ABY6J382_9BACT|nr:c-type cytochrome [Chitinophaga horti]UYQ94129.1 c-type cytochrome [Chitinophaga horti]